jgi:hypothetical protein
MSSQRQQIGKLADPKVSMNENGKWMATVLANAAIKTSDAYSNQIPITPTHPLSDAEQLYFDILTTSSPYHIWTQSDLLLATEISKLYVKRKIVDDLLNTIDWFPISGKNRAVVVHPAWRLFLDLTNSINRYVNQLGLDPRTQLSFRQDYRNVEAAKDIAAAALLDSINNSGGLLADVDDGLLASD